MKIRLISIILVLLTSLSISQIMAMNNTKSPLPKIELTNSIDRKAENFLLNNQIRTVERLGEAIYDITPAQTQDWLLVAQAYERINTEASINLSMLIYYHIQINKSLYYYHRSVALLALSKIVSDSNPEKALQFAGEARDIDDNNPRAWQRFGDLVLDIEEKRQAYKTMLSLAIVMRDEKFKIRALARIADTCEQNLQLEDAKQYYSKVLVLKPNHKVAQNGIQRVRQMQKRLEIK